MIAWLMTVPSRVMRLASQGGTRPPCRGRLALPVRWAMVVREADVADHGQVVRNGARRRIAVARDQGLARPQEDAIEVEDRQGRRERAMPGVLGQDGPEAPAHRADAQP